MKDKEIRALTSEEEEKISGGARQEEYNKEHGKIKIIHKADGRPEAAKKKSNKKDGLDLQ